MYKILFKRFFDLFGAILLIVIVLPICLLILPVISISNNGPVFFIQVRSGMNNKLFHLIKFKTMNDNRDSSGQFLPDKERMTSIGRFIRSLSLDELPQLFNVLKGDMSLVGPRPLLPEYLPFYSSFQARRHEIRPGMTGLSQVKGRNKITWQEKFEMDVWYIDNLSFKLDLKILLLTLPKVLKREDINSADVETMERFQGNNEKVAGNNK